jgi:hypothetical protein
VRFGELWQKLHPRRKGADAIDLQLHGDAPWVVVGPELLRWSPARYVDRTPRPEGRARVLTPVSIVAVLASGWNGVVPFLHPSAARRASRRAVRTRSGARPRGASRA